MFAGDKTRASIRCRKTLIQIAACGAGMMLIRAWPLDYLGLQAFVGYTVLIAYSSACQTPIFIPDRVDIFEIEPIEAKRLPHAAEYPPVRPGIALRRGHLKRAADPALAVGGRPCLFNPLRGGKNHVGVRH